MKGGQRVGNAVRLRRSELGFRSAKQAADAAGISEGTWQQLEAGSRQAFRTSTVAAVAKVLRWPADGLLRIARGDDPASLPTVDYDAKPSSVEERVAALERAVLGLEEQLRELRGTR